jgi:hypothetical protein
MIVTTMSNSINVNAERCAGEVRRMDENSVRELAMKIAVGGWLLVNCRAIALAARNLAIHSVALVDPQSTSASHFLCLNPEV